MGRRDREQRDSEPSLSPPLKLVHSLPGLQAIGFQRHHVSKAVFTSNQDGVTGSAEETFKFTPGVVYTIYDPMLYVVKANGHSPLPDRTRTLNLILALTSTPPLALIAYVPELLSLCRRVSLHQKRASPLHPRTIGRIWRTFCLTSCGSMEHCVFLMPRYADSILQAVYDAV